MQRNENIWQKHESQRGINIPKQSQHNLKIWYQRVLEHYSEHQIEALQAIWFKVIVPKMRLNHVTRDLKTILLERSLKSVNQRIQKGETINNRHTRGVNVRSDYVYFTLALNSSTPRYWDDKYELIQVDCGKAMKDKTSELLGLWIGSHRNNKVLPTQYYDGVARTVFYENDKRRTYYYYPDGTSKNVTIPRVEEIFCADQGLEAIFKGLFYQVMIDIALIGGNFLQRLLNPETSAELLENFFSHAFIPCEYPEAKLCGELHLDKDYIHTQSNFGSDADAVRQFFLFIETSDVKKLNELLNNSPELINTTSDKHTALSLAFEKLMLIKKTEQVKVVTCLYEHAIDPALGDGIGADVLDHITYLVAHHPQLVKTLITGITLTDVPYIRCAINFYGTTQPLLKAAEKGLSQVLQWLIDAGVRPQKTEVSSLLFHVFHNKMFLTIKKVKLTPENTIKWLINHFKLDINDAHQRQPILQLAVQHEQVAFINWWLTTFSNYNVNTINQFGESPLHIAARVAYDKATFNALIAHGGDINQRNCNGSTPYSLARKTNITDRNSNETIATLLKNHQPVMPYPITAKESAQKQIISASAMVIAKDKQHGPMILFVRKQQSTDGISYPYLFPGGLYDHEDITADVTARRECFEETDVKIIAPSIWLTMTCLDAGTYHQHTICYADYSAEILKASAHDDVAEAVWIPWNQVKRIDTKHGTSQFYYQDILIENSNAQAVCVMLSITPSKELCQTSWNNKITEKTRLTKAFNDNNLDQFIKIVRRDCIKLTTSFWIYHSARLKRSVWVDALLKEGTPLNGYIGLGMGQFETVLMLVIRNQEFDLAEKLITFDADVNGQLTSDSPLGVCIEHNNKTSNQFVKKLLCEYKVALNQDLGIKALIKAIDYDNEFAFNLILQTDTKKVININRPYTKVACFYLFRNKQLTLMEHAATSRKLAFIRLLRQHGAELFPHQHSNIFEDVLLLSHHLIYAADRMNVFLPYDLFSLKLYEQHLAVFNCLTDNNVRHFDFKSGKIVVHKPETRLLHKRMIDGEPHILFEYEPENGKRLKYKTPFKLPILSDPIQHDFSEKETLIEFPYFGKEEFSVHSVRYVLIENNEQLSDKNLPLHSKTAKLLWLKWSDITKSNAKITQRYYHHDEGVVTQIDGCLCDHVLNQIPVSANKEDLQHLCLENIFSPPLLLTAYIDNNQTAFDNRMKAGACLNHQYLGITCTPDSYSIPEADKECPDNKKKPSWFTAYHIHAGKKEQTQDNETQTTVTFTQIF